MHNGRPHSERDNSALYRPAGNGELKSQELPDRWFLPANTDGPNRLLQHITHQAGRRFLFGEKVEL